ncbi:DUF732 domain-containing protein [Mycobacterium nebraskense]|uniref:DUF732 domain-containing protein n=1 Tax=Mycobacterium nebraskense TaxID=244292 RepID=A0A0F5NFP9_9MYCO|nr:DUF732 domain-containing protein [Mycobacterium nebraskense]KKC05859.1 hypothetical protein WU83_06215 [Mycobacterium nebraskense]KLO41877.1 hypothetical protein ABW17_13215 [Mycobacterium nebraskense]MBI2692787.1 DUF732 domain-containing protein [Mycobacterium nebraskense]ORW17098.1 hypothetical protein AWC17_13540 [Mycobacterium nebraskense]
MNVGLRMWSAVGAALLCLAALFSAAPASADPSDDAFLGALSANGIAMNGPGAAIGMAHSVCAGLDRNERSSVLAMKVMKDTSLSARQAGFFVGLSVSAYCPQYKGQVDGSLDWLNPLPPLM